MAADDLPVFNFPYIIPFEVTQNFGGVDAEDYGTHLFQTFDRWGRPRRVFNSIMTPADFICGPRELMLFYRNRFGGHRPFLFPAGSFNWKRIRNGVPPADHEPGPALIGFGDGATTTFTLPDSYIDPQSLEIEVAGVAQQGSELILNNQFVGGDLTGWAPSTYGWPAETSQDVFFKNIRPGVFGYSLRFDLRSTANSSAFADSSGLQYGLTAPSAGLYRASSWIYPTEQYEGVVVAPDDTRMLAPVLTSFTGATNVSNEVRWSTETRRRQWIPQILHPTLDGGDLTGTVDWSLSFGYVAGGKKRVAYVSLPSFRKVEYTIDDLWDTAAGGTKITFQTPPASGARIEASYNYFIPVRFNPGGITFSPVNQGVAIAPGRIVLNEDFRS